MEEIMWKCADDILCGVNLPKDPANLSDLEKKHIPVIEAPETVRKDELFAVTVEVGKYLVHPNEVAHFIEWVELYCGETFLARASFSGGSSYPKVVFQVKLSHSHGVLKAREKCNLHGLWEGTRELKVVAG